MFPFAVALLSGRWRRIGDESRPGNVLSWLLQHALTMVCTGGEPNVWWWYIASMGLELVGITLLMIFLVVCWMSVLLLTCYGFLLSGVILAVLFSFIIHRTVLVHFLPLSIIHPKCFTWQSIFVNFTSHPELHIFTTDIREFDAHPGLMCPSLALVGSCVRFSVHVWVDDTHEPSGSLALSGILAGVIFVIGDVVTRKWLVAHESSIAQSFIDFMLMSTFDKIVLAA